MEAADWITAISVLIGVITYIVDKFIDRKKATSEELSRLFDVYYETIAKKEDDKDYFKKARRYMGEIERFCIGVNSHAYSKCTLRKYGSKFFVMLYKKYKDYIIEKTRLDFKDNSKYLAFERIAIDFMKKEEKKEKV